MKIEHIIEDIIADTLDIRSRVESAISSQSPGLDFTINLPGLEKLSVVKEIELTLHENGKACIISAEIHTQNINRVFAQARCRISPNSGATNEQIAQRELWFLHILRET